MKPIHVCMFQCVANKKVLKFPGDTPVLQHRNGKVLLIFRKEDLQNGGFFQVKFDLPRKINKSNQICWGFQQKIGVGAIPMTASVMMMMMMMMIFVEQKIQFRAKPGLIQFPKLVAIFQGVPCFVF